MLKVTAHYDGKSLILHEPVALRKGEVVQVEISRKPSGLLSSIADWAEALPADPDSPGDAAANHDRYLYGTPEPK